MKKQKTKTKPVVEKRAETKDVEIVGVRHTSEYLAFIDWAATPSMKREITTMQEFAASIGVNNNTLTEWKKREGFAEAVRQARKRYFGGDMVGDVLMGLYKKCLKDGTAAEVKLLMQYVGELREDGAVSMSPELQKAIDKISNKL